MKKIALGSVIVLLVCAARAQNYQAIHGSPYAGGLGIYNNPASGVHSHDNWDITLFAGQVKSSTNSFSATKAFPGLPSANVYLSNGDIQRYLHLSQDFHVLNTRFKLGRRRAVAFGFNTRNYVHVRSKAFKFVDTISSFNSFLQYNRPAPAIGGNIVNNTWGEIYLNYSQILRETNSDQLSVGVTVKGIRGVSGVYLQLDRLRFTEITRPGQLPAYVVTDPGGKYGYSSNYDQLQDGKSTGQNINDFLRFSQGSFGVDIGAEYLIKDDYAPLYDDMERLEYNTKIGISILDVGRNLYKHGRYSRTFNGVLTDVSDDELENKFSSPDDIEDFYDSLETVVQHLQVPATNYYIWQPTRLVINVDKHLRDNFYINGELSVNFFSTRTTKHLRTRELNVLSVTPRWETSLLGVYLPVQVNAQGQLWIGTAFKAGPLLLGIHDWRSLMSKNKIFNGGAYLALVVRNFFSSSQKERNIKYMDCPRL